MTEQKQMTENVELSDEDLDGVAGGAAYIKYDGVVGNRASRGIIVPDYKVGLTFAGPTPHPGPASRHIPGDMYYPNPQK